MFFSFPSGLIFLPHLGRTKDLLILVVLSILIGRLYCPFVWFSFPTLPQQIPFLLASFSDRLPTSRLMSRELIPFIEIVLFNFLIIFLVFL